ncbi:MAG TPA: MerR family transcriptional regulator [Oscillatoriaceae cyanobacterium]
MPEAMVEYSIAVVSRLTGLKADTIRAWERRYGAIVPARSQGRQRSYSAADVSRLLLLQKAIEAGQAIGRIAQLPDDALKELVPTADTPQPVGLDAVLLALEHFDAPAADRELRRLAALMPPRRFVRELAVPLMHRMGAAWAEGRFGVAQEHLGTALLRSFLDAMLRVQERAADRAPLLLATLPGELHELGLLSVGLLAATYGVPVLPLGPQLPVDEIARAARATHARVIGLSAASASETLLEDLEALDAALGPDQAIWLGGRGCANLPAAELPSRCRVFGPLESLEPELVAWGRERFF